jgi:hypothetical protein
MARNSKKKTQEQKSLPFIQPDAAGIDIGATEIYVAVPEERDIRPVRKFATFTEDLHALADWLSNQNGGHGIDRSLLDRPFPDPGATGFGSLPGQRPPCQRGAGARQTVAKSLVGDYRPEHLFSLQQALENYRHFQNQIAACDQHIERMLARFDSQEQCAEAPSTKYKAQGNQPSFNVLSELGPIEVERIREMWELRCNRVLRKTGLLEGVNRRSLKAQGIKRPAAQHLGPKAAAMTRNQLPATEGGNQRGNFLRIPPDGCAWRIARYLSRKSTS